MRVIVVYRDDDAGGHERGAVAVQRPRVGRRIDGGVDGREHAALDGRLWTDGAVPVLIVDTGTMPAGGVDKSVHDDVRVEYEGAV